MPVLRLLLALVLLAGPVLADTNADVRAHFKKGQMHYALGEFPEAIGEFREAFRLKQEPAILFNLAQTYRQLHEWQHAYFHYRQYLIAKPNAVNRAEVEGFIEQMKNHMDEEDRAARADFNHLADGAPRQAPPAVAQSLPAAVAPSSSAAAPEPGPSEARSAAATPPSSPSSLTAAGAAPSTGGSSSSISSDSAHSASPSAPLATSATTEPAPVAVANQSPPVVLAAQPIPAAAAPSPKPDFVDSSPGPLVVEKHTSGWRYTGYAMIGVGLVAGGVAYAMHSSAQSSADQFNGKYQAGALTASDTKLRDDAESKGKLATESLIAGIALVATGTALTITF